jgi:hypothetical protein
MFEEEQMKKIVLNLCVCISCYCLHGQINRDLKAKLDSIQLLDQTLRIEVSNVMTNKYYLDSLSKKDGFVMSDYVKNVMLKQESIDKTNLAFIDSIIKVFGYPGKKLVGDATCQTAWYIIQHSDKIDKYYKLLQRASKKGEIPDSLFAKTKDRFRIMHGKKQLFGTQAECLPNDAGNFDCFISPIRNPKKVNSRRNKAGFTITIEKYATMNRYDFKIKQNRK